MIAPNSIKDSPLDHETESKSQKSHVDAILRDAKEIAELVRHYLTARKDSVVLRARAFLLWTIAGFAVAAIVLVALLTATVILIVGLADGLGSAFGQVWLGRIIVGGALLAGTAIVASLLVLLRIRSSHKQTVSTYASRHHHQRVDFGQDVRGNVR